MSSFIKVMICMIVTVLIATLVIPPVAAVDAEAPAWQEGEVWAYGKKVYLEPAMSELIGSVEELLEQSGTGSLEKAYINGSVEAYTYCKVTSVTTNECVMEVYIAVGLDAVVDIRANMMMSVPGTYWIWESNIPKEQVAVTVQGNADLMAFEKATITFEKSSMALKSITSLTSFKADVSLEAKNLGEKIRFEGDEKIITRAEDIDLDLEMDLDINTMFEFDPYLDILDFPIAVGEEWTVYSVMTATGNVSGSLDAHGLPEGALEDLVQPTVGELTFPLDFSTFTGQIGDLHVENGQLDGASETISADLRCTSKLEIEDEVHGELTVYEIKVMAEDGSTSTFYYSPELCMFSSMRLSGETVPDDIFEEIPFGIAPEEDLVIGPMEPKKAAQGIYDVSGIVVAEGVDTSDGDDNGLGLGIIMIGSIAALVVVILAFVIVKRKK